MKLQLKRSQVTTGEAGALQPLPPTPPFTLDGELAVNFNASQPALFIEDASGNIVRLDGNYGAYSLGKTGTATSAAINLTHNPQGTNTPTVETISFLGGDGVTIDGSGSNITISIDTTDPNVTRSVTGGPGIIANDNVAGNQQIDADIDLTAGLMFSTADPATASKIQVNLKTGGGIGFESGALGLSLSDDSITGTLAVGDGGTGTSTGPSAGHVLIGLDDGNYAPAFLTAGTGIGITSASGAITIAGDALPPTDADNNYGYWSRTSSPAVITPRTSGDSLDMGTGNISNTGTGTFGEVFTDNLRFNNTLTIETTENNGNVIVNAHGTGEIILNKKTVVNGDVEIEGGTGPRKLQLNNSANDGFIGHRASDSLATAAATEYQWPAAPSENRVLQSTSAGVLSWEVAGPGAISSITGGAGIAVSNTNQVDVDLATISGLEFDAAGNDGKLRIDAHNGVEITADGLSADLGNGLAFDGSNQITVDLPSSNPGLEIDANNKLDVKIHDGLEKTADGISTRIHTPGVLSDQLQLDADGNTVTGGNALGLRVPGDPTISNQIPIWRADGAVLTIDLSDSPVNRFSDQAAGDYVGVETTVDQGPADAEGLTVNFTVNANVADTNIQNLTISTPGSGYSTSSVLNVTGHQQGGQPLQITVEQAQVGGAWEITVGSTGGGGGGGGGAGDLTGVNAGDGIRVDDAAGPIVTVHTDNLADGGIIYRGASNELAIDLSASDIQGTLATADGGTGLSATPTNGQLLIGNTSTNGYTLRTLTAGNGVAITNGNGSISIAANGAPNNNGNFGYWSRNNSTRTLSPRTANDNLNVGSGSITTTGQGAFGNVRTNQVEFNNALTITTTANNGAITLLTNGSGDINLNTTGGNGDVVTNSNIIIPNGKVLTLQNNDSGDIYDVNFRGDAEADVTYAWPEAPSVANYVLTSSTAGQLSWIDVGTITPDADGAYGFWDRDSATSTLSPRTLNDNILLGNGQLTTSSQINTPLVTHTNSLSITTTGSNGNIVLNPHGSGEVRTNNSNFNSGSGTITSSASFKGPVLTNSAALSITTTAADGNITIDPNGSGQTRIEGTARVTGNVSIRGGNNLILNNASNNGYVQHTSNAGSGADSTYSWPAAPGSNSYLRSNSNGQLAWVTAANISPPSNGNFGHWTRNDGTNTLGPRKANDNLNMGSGSITTTGAISGASVSATGNVSATGELLSSHHSHGNTLTIRTTGSNGNINLTTHGTGVIRSNDVHEIRSGNTLRLYKADNAKYVSHGAAGAVSTNTNYLWPVAPTSTRYLRSNSSGTLSWSSANNHIYDLTNTTGSDPSVRLSGSGSASGNDDVPIIGGTNIAVSGAAGGITIAGTGNWHTFTCVQTGGNNTNPQLRLAGSSNQNVQITGGSNVTVTRTSNTALTIEATDTNTTYTHTCVQTNSNNSDPSIRLAGGGNNADVQIKGGTNITVTRNSNSQLTIDGPSTIETASKITITGNNSNSYRDFIFANVGAATNSSASILTPTKGINEFGINPQLGRLRGNFQVYQGALITRISGTRGNVEISDDNKGAGWAGYNIAAGAAFIDNGAIMGLWDDTNNQWFLECEKQGGAKLYHNTASTETVRLETTADGVTVTGDVTATTFNGALSGNASTATKLKTSRNLWGQSFNGSANVSGAITGATTVTGSNAVMTIEPAESTSSRNLFIRGNNNKTSGATGGNLILGHEGRGSIYFRTGTASTGYRFYKQGTTNIYAAFKFDGLSTNRTITWPNKGGTVAFTTDLPTEISGNAGSATKLQNTRKIWGRNFDGTADITGTFRQNHLVINNNDGYGNGNICFNHNGGTPTMDGSSGRITCNHDNATAEMKFGLLDNAVTSVTKNTTTILTLKTAGVESSVDITAPNFHGTADDSGKLDGLSKTDFLRRNAADTLAAKCTINSSGSIVAVQETEIGSKIKFGRSTSQYYTFSGTSAGNFLTSVSPSSNTKDGLRFATSIDGGATVSKGYTLEGGRPFTSGYNDIHHNGKEIDTGYGAKFGGNITCGAAGGTLIVGTGGAAGLTLNDGGGNCNVTFNHAGNKADQDGNAGRISVNTDSTANANMYFTLYEGVTEGEKGTDAKVLQLRRDSGANYIHTLGRFNIDGTGNPESSGLLVNTNPITCRYLNNTDGEQNWHYKASIKTKEYYGWGLGLHVISAVANKYDMTFGTMPKASDGLTTKARITHDGKFGVGFGYNNPNVPGLISAKSDNTHLFVAEGNMVSDAGYPAYGFSGQTSNNNGRGTGMYLFQDNELAFATRAKARMIVQQDGCLFYQTNDVGNKDKNAINNFVYRTTSGGNDSKLICTTYRTLDGTDWTTLSTKLSLRIDDTSMGYIEWNPRNNGAGTGSKDLAFGTGVSEVFRLHEPTKCVGIGSKAPQSKLTVRDSGTANDNRPIRIESYRPGLRLVDLSTNAHSGEILTDQNVMTFRLSKESSVSAALTTRVTINTSGNLTATGDLIAYSDKRVKTDIKPIENALEKVQQINGVTFARTDIDDDKRHAGVIAQEVEKVLPEVVHEANDIKSVAYGNMVGLLIEAIKEQQIQIDELKKQLEG